MFFLSQSDGSNPIDLIDLSNNSVPLQFNLITLFLPVIIISNKLIRLVVSQVLLVTKVNNVFPQPDKWDKSKSLKRLSSS